MASLTGLTFGKLDWIPKFVQSINKDTCLGCGRCFKVCGQNVLSLLALNEDGEFVDEDDDEIERKVMAVINQVNCIGCEACARICPKNCYTHAPLPA
ncbi:ferredoxin III, nif-specific [Crocosphaera sp. XPORK-15E]|uniref:ferredoxin III, nif-specific n=1 Tax=Crocosphaera sp. XPORK-15E TaxID=3110247 RepID=UPI002B204E88|nr:ferredoxin III, nif-specific [Crocosphaera sp. XPORK-15E]MEA5533404.1 ferredoxin III, nif-specific [Crocosphaera sp. XPORK-15E]